MPSALDLEVLIRPQRLSALIARSQRNIERSAALLAAAKANVREGRCNRRPRRMLRTWTKLNAGVLPSCGARHRWVGPGRGERCNACGDRIASRDTAVEVDFCDALLLQFHAACFKAWESFGGRRR